MKAINSSMVVLTMVFSSLILAENVAVTTNHPSLLKIEKQSTQNVNRVIKLPAIDSNIFDDVAKFIESLISNRTSNSSNDSKVVRIPLPPTNSSLTEISQTNTEILDNMNPTTTGIYTTMVEDEPFLTDSDLEDVNDYEAEHSEIDCSDKDENEVEEGDDETDCDEDKIFVSTTSLNTSHPILSSLITSKSLTTTTSSESLRLTFNLTSIIINRTIEEISSAMKVPQNFTTSVPTSLDAESYTSTPSVNIEPVPVPMPILEPTLTTTTLSTFLNSFPSSSPLDTEILTSSNSSLVPIPTIEMTTPSQHRHESTITYMPRPGKKFLDFDNDGHLKIGNSITVVDVTSPGCAQCSLAHNTVAFNTSSEIQGNTSFVSGTAPFTLSPSSSTSLNEVIISLTISESSLFSSTYESTSLPMVETMELPALSTEEQFITPYRSEVIEMSTRSSSIESAKSFSHRFRNIDFDFWNEITTTASRTNQNMNDKASKSIPTKPSSSQHLSTGTLILNSPLPITRTFGGVISPRTNRTSVSFPTFSEATSTVISTIILPFMVMTGILLM